ncbi:MAG: tRNA (N(6)-L-threonylcarbamoyladenosine(37)-C(2))-methylthiotransferase MtaB, partial [Nautilia sp.]
ELMENLVNSEITKKEEEADILVINSCTVTNSADSNLRNYISQISRKNPDAKILVTGCAAHSIGEELYKDKRIFGVFGHSEKEKINEIINKDRRFYEISDLNFINENIVTDISGKTRAFIKIQEGCDFECAYCIIPQVRGNARSMPEEKILSQIEVLSKNGFSEFILTGINMGSYGKDTNTSLAKLLKKIFDIPAVKRVRLGSLEPSQIDEEFMEIIQNEKLERHLHIALQYSDDEMLRIMKRRNRVNKTLKLFNKLADKGFALGTDFIVGHPGETEEMFNRAFENLKKFPITHIHTFRYSPREGTYSATLKQNVPGDVAKKRHKQIEELVKEKNLEFRKRNKIPLKVLIEEEKNGYYQGFDQFFNKVLVKSQTNLIHQWIEIKEYEIKEVNYAEK